MLRLVRLLPLLTLGVASLLPAGEAAAMCGGNILATCKPRPPSVQPAAAPKPAGPARRRKARPPSLRR